MSSALTENEEALALRAQALDLWSKEQFKRNLNLVDGKIRILEVTTSQEMEQFVLLPYEIYKDDPIWPGQNDQDILAYFDPVSNPALAYIKMQLFLAFRDGKVIGRLCASINEKYNLHWGQNVGFFGFFESINEQAVADVLFEAAAEWLKKNGKNEMHGPLSLTYMDVVGVLVDNFGEVPMKNLSYNPPYYSTLLEKYGFVKHKDMYDLQTTTESLSQHIEDKMEKIYPFLEDESIIARYFDKNNEEDSKNLRNLFQDSFRQHLGFYDLDDEEWDAFLNHYLENVYDDLFVIVEDAGEPIAFGICLKDDNQLLHASRNDFEGKITRQRLDLIGVKPDYIRAGIGTFLVYNLLPGLQAHETENFSISWIFDDNNSSLGLCRNLGMHVDKTFRVYRKQI